MTITDWIAIAAASGATTYTMTGIGLLIRKTRAQRRAGLKPAPTGETALRYSDFTAADAKACCAIMTEAVQSWNLPYLEMLRSGRVVEKVYVNYCPQCGRKL